MDDRKRELERRARQGDTLAIAALKAMEVRLGAHPHQLSPTLWWQFVHGGVSPLDPAWDRETSPVNAIFTVMNTGTELRQTFRVRRFVVRRPSGATYTESWLRVELLAGPDNTRDYTWVASFHEVDARHELWSVPSEPTPPVLHILHDCGLHNQPWPAHLVVYHEGRCGRCGRRLTVPDSIEAGIGPECRNKANTGAVGDVTAGPEDDEFTRRWLRP